MYLRPSGRVGEAPEGSRSGYTRRHRCVDRSRHREGCCAGASCCPGSGWAEAYSTHPRRARRQGAARSASPCGIACAARSGWRSATRGSSPCGDRAAAPGGAASHRGPVQAVVARGAAGLTFSFPLTVIGTGQDQRTSTREAPAAKQAERAIGGVGPWPTRSDGGVGAGVRVGLAVEASGRLGALAQALLPTRRVTFSART